MAEPKDREREPEAVEGAGARRRQQKQAKYNTEVRRQVDRLDGRIDDMQGDVVQVRESVARIEGGMQQLVVSYNRTAQFAAEQASAELDLRKTERLQELADKADESKLRREVRREVYFKLMAVFMGIWAIVASALAAKC